ncbi:MAG: glycosyltransferase family 2 protein [Phenylobacterium sp.]
MTATADYQQFIATRDALPSSHGDRREGRVPALDLPPRAPRAPTARPKVTVMIITYNHAKYIAQAIDSVLAQETDFSVAIHVIDDCSTDGAQDIIRDYAARYPGIVKPFINKTNIGSKVTQRNFYKGFCTLDGDYIAILEGDDYWTSPQRLQAHVAFLRRTQTSWAAPTTR